VVNINIGCGVKQANEHLRDIEEELLKRGLLTSEEVKLLNT
jgi:polyhydroxyalkanoate synthesis regulator phasin